MLSARMRAVSEIRPDHFSVRSRPSPSNSLLRETVTRAIKRFDRIEFGIDLAELAPHPLDVAVDRAVVDIDVVLIRRIHQLIARLDHAGPLRKRLENQEF